MSLEDKDKAHNERGAKECFKKLMMAIKGYSASRCNGVKHMKNWRVGDAI